MADLLTEYNTSLNQGNTPNNQIIEPSYTGDGGNPTLAQSVGGLGPSNAKEIHYVYSTEGYPALPQAIENSLPNQHYLYNPNNEGLGIYSFGISDITQNYTPYFPGLQNYYGVRGLSNGSPYRYNIEFQPQ